MSTVNFVIAVGRSGTKFVSEMLEKSERLNVYHEPDFKMDFKNYRQRFIGYQPLFSNRNFVNLKQVEITKRMMATPKKFNHYVEVNGVLRLHGKDLKKEMGANVFGIIRNGKDVVRSIVSKSGSVAMELAKIKKVSLFELACMQWGLDNQIIVSSCDKIWRFESILAAYRIQNRIFEAFKIPNPFTEESWKKFAAKKVNETKNYKIGEYESWSSEQKAIFEKHCGELMEKLRYVQ